MTEPNRANQRALRPGELSPQQKQAAALCAIGANDTAIAAELGVAPGTVRGWKSKERFRDEVDRLVDEVQRGYTRQARAYIPSALTCLRDIYADPNHRPHDRINAAKAVLDRFKFDDVSAVEPGRRTAIQARDGSGVEIPDADVATVWNALAEIQAANDAAAREAAAQAVRQDDDDDDDDWDDDEDGGLPQITSGGTVIQGEIVS